MNHYQQKFYRLGKLARTMLSISTFITTISMSHLYIEKDYELHIFCDASSKAFGTVAYLTSAHQAHNCISKSWVAPLEEQTLLSLELLSIIVGCGIANYLQKRLTSINIH